MRLRANSEGFTRLIWTWTLTCGRLALICRCKLSRSFSQSPSLPSISLRRSCASRRLSMSLSRSSSIDTMSCSKLASSPPLNCDDLCEIESSLMVGRTSHIMFHILHCRSCTSLANQQHFSLQPKNMINYSLWSREKAVEKFLLPFFALFSGGGGKRFDEKKNFFSLLTINNTLKLRLLLCFNLCALNLQLFNTI